jgi:hypothetical protein
LLTSRKVLRPSSGNRVNIATKHVKYIIDLKLSRLINVIKISRGISHINIGFEVIATVVMNVALFWDIVRCSPYVKRSFIFTLVFARLIFDPEDEGHTFLRNVGSHKDYTELYPRRWQHSATLN